MCHNLFKEIEERRD